MEPVWILDSACRHGVDLWCRHGSVECRHCDYDPPFYLYLPDPIAYHEMIDALGELYRGEACSFRTLPGDLDGFSVYAGRAVAEAIERQTQGDSQFFSVDVWRDQVYCNAVQNLPRATPQVLAISRRISRVTYAHRCIEGTAVQAYRDAGVEIAPGMKISYVVRDARMYRADPEWAAERFDLPYYRGLIDKAWKEISYAFPWNAQDVRGWWKAQKGLVSPEYSGQPESLDCMHD